jgi:NAD(P)-dependent dehydrogenase (short-subunit alcohol dehydrogenase family)
MKLKRETAVVTGAGRGIGRAMAIAQAREGAQVALLARTEAEVAAVAGAISDQGGTARAYRVDLVDLDAVTRTLAKIERDLGPVGLLTNNAGAFRAIGPIWTVDPAEWWSDVEVNVRGTFNCCRAVVPGMIERRRGRIINMTGGGTATSFPNGSGYATSKAGILRFTECLSDSLIDTGVLVFAMDPGLVRTRMTEYQLNCQAGRDYLPHLADTFAAGVSVPPERAAAMAVEIGTGRFDRIAGRLLMAARDDLDALEATMDDIVAKDFRSLRVNGLPPERR